MVTQSPVLRASRASRRRRQRYVDGFKAENVGRDSPVTGEIGLPVDGRGEDSTDTSHPDDDGGRDGSLCVGDRVGRLVRQDRGYVRYSVQRDSGSATQSFEPTRTSRSN